MLDDCLEYAKSAHHPYKSYGESQIAGLLDRYGLPFIYEKPTAVMDEGKLRIWYPDFSLSHGPIIEYIGVNGEVGYQKRTEHKLAVYQRNQLAVVPWYSRDLARGWENRLLRRIDSTLEGHLHRYRLKINPAPTYHPRPYRAR
jgi:hypothetical protein